jgi:excisionase family DNA binding protein
MDATTQNNATAAMMKPDEAFALMGGKRVISRASFYHAIGRNEIPHIRLGRRIVIPRAAFERWLAGERK